MSTNLPPLPQGFSLESDLPPLPQGFSIEGAPPAPGKKSGVMPGEEIFEDARRTAAGSPVRAAAQRIGSFTLGNAAAAVDLAWGLVPQIGGIIAEANERMKLTARGLPKAQRDPAAAQVKQDFVSTFDQPIGKIMRLFGFGETYDEADINKVMQMVGAAAERGGEAVAERTSGRVSKEDVLSFIDAATAGLGVAGAKYSLRRLDARTDPQAQLRAPAPNAFYDRLNRFDRTLGGPDTPYRPPASAAAPAAPDTSLPGVVRERLAAEAEGRPTPEQLARPDVDLRRLDPEEASRLATDEARAFAEPLQRAGLEADAAKRAYILMRDGADAKRVEAELRRAGKDSTLGQAMAILRARRADAEAAFAQLPERPIREDGSFAPNALSAMLRRPSPMGAAEGAAREAAQGVARGPLGEPIDVGVAKTGKSQRINSIALAGLGTAGAAALLYGNWDVLDAEEASALIGLGALSAMPAKAPLGALRNAADGTLLTLERLDGKKFDFGVEEVRNQAKRADVTKLEREAIDAVLDAHKGDRITAMELVRGLSEKTEFAKLTKVETQEYAPHGLEAIGRFREMDPDVFADMRRDGVDIGEVETPPARTNIYKSPFATSAANHFGEKGYFAHTRSFDEDGVRHVVEVQSDLAQKAGRRLTPEERAGLEGELEAMKLEQDALDGERLAKIDEGERLFERLSREGRDATSPEWQRHLEEGRALRDQAIALRRRNDVRRGEIGTKLRADDEAGALEPVAPMAKGWYKRVIREEIADAAKGPLNPKYKELQEQIELHEQGARNNVNYPEIARVLTEQADAVRQELARTPANLEPPKAIRFADADTVAKVEGWLEESTTARIKEAYEDSPKMKELWGRDYAVQAPRILREFEAELRRLARNDPKEIAKIPERMRTAEANMRKAKEAGYLFSSPDYAGIYVRYLDEQTKFYKQLGAKHVTDSAGRGWWEIPLDANPKLAEGGIFPGGRGAGSRRVALGAVDPQLQNTIALLGLGAGVGFYLSDGEDRAYAAGLGALVAGAGRLAFAASPAIREAGAATARALDNNLGVLSAQVRNISQPALRRLRDLEMSGMRGTYNSVDRISAFANGIARAGTAVRDAAALALFNSDYATARAALTPELQRALGEAQTELRRLGTELRNAGVIKGLVDEYFPRLVTDRKGLLESLDLPVRDELEKRLALTRAKFKDSPYLDVEESATINKFLAERKIAVPGKPSFAKARRIDQLNADMLRFYAPPEEALTRYVQRATWEIEKAKFFGKSIVKDADGRVDANASIGKLVQSELRAGRIKTDDVVELTELLEARFNGGERAGHAAGQAFRQGVSMMLLGNITSAAIQLGDVFYSAALNGILPTLNAIGTVVTKGRNAITARQFGLVDHLAEELVTPNGLRRATDAVFRLSGFRLVDLFAKDVFLTAAHSKALARAKSARGVEAMRQKYGEYFGPDDFEQLVRDLQAKNRTHLVDEYLFAELSRVQPVSRTEVPRNFLKHPNGRMIWLLKSWMLKQVDLVRQEVYGEFRAGRPAKATEMGLRLGAAMLASNMAGETIRSFLLNREVPEYELEDIPNNLLKTFALSEYVQDQMAQGKPVSALLYNIALPPHKMFDEILRADPSAVKYIPLIGRHAEALGIDALGIPSGNIKWAENQEKRREREANKGLQ